jgi:hypothetical protein
MMEMNFVRGNLGARAVRWVRRWVDSGWLEGGKGKDGGGMTQ